MGRSQPSSEVVAVGLDLGSSFFKAGLLDGRGRLGRVTAVPAPELNGDEGRREGDATAHARTAAALLERVAGGLPAGTPLGIASQRSSFVIWDRETGRPIMPLVSWQDRRAADWCARHGHATTEVFSRTGLVLSAHYAGPKLAAMQEAEPALAAALRSGRVLFGNLDTYLIWLWSGQRIHETDLTMAARTSMLELRAADWSPELLEQFGVPPSILPRVRPSRGFRHRLERGPTLAASVADQAASALALFPSGADCALVNLGTGGFALRPAQRDERRPGYLTGPFDGDASNPRYALEGTINGAGAAVDRFGRGRTDLPVADPSPEAFCLPDVAGVGSPYWRPDLGLTLSAAAELLPPEDRRRIVLEGLLFRIRQLLGGIGGDRAARLLLAGGLVREPFVGRGLAALLDRSVEVLELPEAGLIGAARLAAGLPPSAETPTTRLDPGIEGSYLLRKYDRWSDWLRSVLEGHPHD